MKENPSVVITGASSGIGRAAVRRMSGAGWRVFAGVRRSADGDALVAGSGGLVVPVLLDVTNAESITQASAFVHGHLDGGGLAGLVNNAGIGVTGPLEYLSPDALRRQFEVNVFGPFAVTQAFLPEIRRAGGRIINIGSIGDRFTMPFGGPLCASKHAVASLNDALRQELYPFGIRVSLIEPASIHSEAVGKLKSENRECLARMLPEARSRYGEMFEGFTRKAIAEEEGGSAPAVVADTIFHALTSRRPKARYLCGKGARLLATLAWLLPEEAFDRVRRRLFDLPSRFGSRSV